MGVNSSFGFIFGSLWDFFTKCDIIITKCDKSLLQNASAFLLQNSTVILPNTTVATKCDKGLLQNASVHTLFCDFNIAIISLILLMIISKPFLFSVIRDYRLSIWHYHFQQIKKRKVEPSYFFSFFIVDKTFT